jgi:hypothetical protein
MSEEELIINMIHNLEELRGSVVGSVENLDGAMTVRAALVQMDKRIRALELEQRKADRKKPVIVNQHGERAN